MIQRFKFRKVFIFAILITFVLNPFFTHLQVFAHENINDKDISEEAITLYDLNLEEDEEFTTLYCEELNRKSEVIDINNEELTEYFKELDINVIDEELKTFINSLEIECEIFSEDENKDVDDKLTLSDEDKNSSSSNNTETDNNNSTEINNEDSSSNSNKMDSENSSPSSTEQGNVKKNHEEKKENNFKYQKTNIKESSPIVEQEQKIQNATVNTNNTSELKKGDNNAKVKKLKQDLAKLDFVASPNPNGYFGVQTEKKVKEFQSYYGLKSTGIANKATLDKIKAVLASPLQKGKSHSDVIKLKQNLDTLGFKVVNNPNKYFGVQTEKQLKAFQKKHGLAISGIAEEVTLKKIESLLKTQSTDLKKGDNNPEVKKLKQDLAKLGFVAAPNPNGYFGVQTEKKVKEFQTYYGLTATGIANKATLNKVNEILSSPLQKGKSSKEIANLKKNLNKIGYGGIQVTNYFGDFMEKRVKEFQRDNKLPVSGIIDSKTENAIKNYKMFKIFIDPGHGGSDPGAIGNGLKEKDLTLQIANALKKHLENTYSNVLIMMSRTTDKYLSLKERTDMANKWGADYFISVHINSFTSSSANGFESYIHNSNSTAEDNRMQNIIHDEITKGIPSSDRGKKSSNFHVLRESKMPSILLEYLFITNKNDATNLKNNSFIDKLGKLTAQGVAKGLKLAKK